LASIFCASRNRNHNLAPLSAFIALDAALFDEIARRCSRGEFQKNRKSSRMWY
jgi:hypothetical protein